MLYVFRIVIFHIADRNFRKNIFICVNSGKTEYQTTKASKARRSASFERRPSRRYSRRTMQNRGKNTSGKSDTSHYTPSASIIVRLTSKCLLCVFFVCVCTQDNWILLSEYTDEIRWFWFCMCQTPAVCPSVYTSVNQMLWLTHSHLIHFEVLTVILLQR